MRYTDVSQDWLLIIIYSRKHVHIVDLSHMPRIFEAILLLLLIFLYGEKFEEGLYSFYTKLIQIYRRRVNSKNFGLLRKRGLQPSSSKTYDETPNPNRKAAN